MEPLVSICIPTYNRAEYLQQTIESIICQPEFKSGEVEIVVSDNASTDNTNGVCIQYAQYDNFFYNRNDKNVRDINFPTVLSKAHGKLRKLNNDTFVLKNNALKQLCDLVKKYDDTRPYIYLDVETKKIRVLNFHDFVLDIGYWVTLLANFTIWDDDCKNIEQDTDGCELLLWQVKKAYEIAYKKGIVVIGQNAGYSVIPKKKDISYGIYKIFYCNYMKLLEPYLENGSLSVEDKEYLEKELLFSFFPDWIIKFELNYSDMQYSKEENLKEAVWNQYKDKPYWHKFEKMYRRRLVQTRVKQFIKRILGKI